MATRPIDTAEQRVRQTTPVNQPPMQPNPIVEALPEDRGWHNEDGPQFVKFEKPGDTYTGTLTEVKEVTMNGKQVQQYTLEMDNGLVKFNGTYAITERLGKHHIGKLVRVRYLGDDVALGTQQNPLRLFQVQTKDKPKPNNATITDEDLPESMRGR